VSDYALELVIIHELQKTSVTATEACLGFLPVAKAFGAASESHRVWAQEYLLWREALHHRVEPGQLFARTGRAPLESKAILSEKK